MTSKTPKFILVHRIKTFGKGFHFQAYQDKVFSVLIRIEDIKRIEEVERNIDYKAHVFTCIFLDDGIDNNTDMEMLVKESVEEIYEKLKNIDDTVLEKTEKTEDL